jgi:STE24 endopeptidase
MTSPPSKHTSRRRVGVLAMAGMTFACAALPIDTSSATELSHRLDLYWTGETLLALLIPAWMLFSGIGARVSRFCRRLARGSRYAALALFAGAFLLANTLLGLPLAYVRRLDLAALRGTTPAGLGPWLANQAMGMVAPMAAALLFLWIPYVAMRRSPRRWWLWSSLPLIPVALFILIAQPVWMGSLTTSYAPLADKSLEIDIKALAARCGIRDIAIVVGGDDTTVVGLGPTNRIVLQQDLTRVETPAQIRFTVGHELKHYVMGDNWKAFLIASLFILAGLWITHRTGLYALSHWQRHLGFDQLDDPASLPLMVFCMTALWLAITPAFLAFDRHIEREADRFGLELTHENDAAAKLFASWISGTEPADPAWFGRVFRDTHPSPGERMRMAGTYRPWEHGAPPRYGAECDM